jgi:hypothetical protein
MVQQGACRSEIRNEHNHLSAMQIQQGCLSEAKASLALRDNDSEEAMDEYAATLAE